MKCTIFLVSLLTLLGISSAAFNPAYYPSSKTLTEGYTVYWRVDVRNDLIYIALKVNTTGWVGFGLGDPKSGSMPGADIAIITVVNGVGTVEDRYATAFAKPTLDDCQDWILLNAQEADGITTVEISRKLKVDESNLQDRSIIPGNNNVLWAFGTSDTFGYHGNHNRGFNYIKFYTDPLNPEFVIPETDLQSADLVMNDAQVPVAATTYIIEVFELPAVAQGPAHIVSIEPIIDKIDHVHHFFVYACENTTGSAVTYAFGKPTIGATTGCTLQVFAWGKGGNSLVLPAVAGVLMNDSSNGVRFIIIQIHYTNLDLIPGVVDRSGIRVTWTRQMRQFDAGMLMLGDPYLRSAPVPAGVASYHREYTCASTCTSTWDHDIIVFGDFLHMHQLATQAWGTQYNSNGTSLGFLDRIEYYAYDKQSIQPVPNAVIKRGDRLATHCVWDSSKQVNDTKMGLATTDEMCAEVLFYYPALKAKNGASFQLCAMYTNTLELCGNSANIIPVTQPATPSDDSGYARIWGKPQPTCAARYTCKGSLSSTTTSTWGTSGTMNLVLTNTGTQPIIDAHIDINGTVFPWALDGGSGDYSVPSYGLPIPPSGSYNNAGLVYANGSPSIALDTVTCPLSQTSAPVPGCSAIVSTNNVNWGASGQVTITIRNTGTRQLKSVSLGIAGDVQSTYNLSPSGVPGVYTTPSYVSVWPGSSYSGSGVLYNGQADSITVYLIESSLVCA